MNALQKSIELGLTGTKQEKIDILVTLTFREVSVGILTDYLHSAGLLYSGRNGEASGSLANVVHPQLDRLYAVLDSNSQKSIDAHNMNFWGRVFVTLILDLETAGELTADQVSDIYAIGGGRPYKDLTMTEVNQLIQDAADETAEQDRQDTIIALRAEIENEYINPAISDGTSSAATVRAAVKAGL